MNNLVLSIVLFVAYFSFVSCTLYSRKNSAIQQKETPVPIEREIEKMLDEIYEFAPSEQEIDPFELPEVLTTPASPEKKKGNTNKKASKLVNLAKLNLRQARVACRVLNLQQNHKLAWMQKQINQCIWEHPEKVSEVYQALADKFGVSVLTDQSLERVAC